MTDARHAVTARIMATIGVAILSVCAALQLYGAVRHAPIEIPHTVFYIGMLIGFAGFYGLDSQRAKDGGDFIVSSVTKFIVAIRSGRRSTDVAVVQVAEGPSGLAGPPAPPDPAEGKP